MVKSADMAQVHRPTTGGPNAVVQQLKSYACPVRHELIDLILLEAHEVRFVCIGDFLVSQIHPDVTVVRDVQTPSYASDGEVLAIELGVPLCRP